MIVLCKIFLTVIGPWWHCGALGRELQADPPVIEKGSREDIVYAFIQHSYLWNHVQIFHLTQNMQFWAESRGQVFAQWLLSVGEGSNQKHGGVEYSMSPPDHVKISGRTAEGGLESACNLPRYL